MRIPYPSSPIPGFLWRIDDTEVGSRKRGFRIRNDSMQIRLNQIGSAFLKGYHSAMGSGVSDRLTNALDSVPPDFRGFAYEGAAMGLALLDWLTPWNRTRVNRFLSGPGGPNTYLVHVGAGWVLARVPGRTARFMSRFDPLLRWLIMDGYGFHEGFFHWQKYFQGRRIPGRVRDGASRIFDQGFGRCLWFIEGGDSSGIQEGISRFEPDRHEDLWSGVGLACVYAGEVAESELEDICARAGPHRPALAQGAAFGAKARKRAGNSTPYQDLACGILCGMNAGAAADITDDSLENLPSESELPVYMVWRQRIQQRFKNFIQANP